jgi:hypothetical protein
MVLLESWPASAGPKREGYDPLSRIVVPARLPEARQLLK